MKDLQSLFTSHTTLMLKDKFALLWGEDQMCSHPHLRYIEWKGIKIYDFQKVSILFKLYIAGLGVLIPKRYHMLG